MARWEMAAANGLLRMATSQGLAFIVASSAMRFRRELRPLQSFEVHSTVVSAGERDMHVLQLVYADGAERAFAGSLVRAVLRRGRELVPPRDVIGKLGADADALPPEPADGGPEIAAMATLEQALG